MCVRQNHRRQQTKFPGSRLTKLPRKGQNTTTPKKDSASPTPLATFEAWIPTIKSAILFGSDGAQIKLEIASTDIKAALTLAEHGQNRVLQVVIFDADSSAGSS